MSYREIDTPLNPTLYELLRQLTDGKVKVVNQGQELKYAIVERDGRRGIRPTSSSEEYVIDCPICGDTKGRCHINHAFGARLEGIPVYHLAYCFNEDCGREVSLWLREEMKNAGKSGGVTVAAAKATSIFDPREATRVSFEQHTKLPGVISLKALAAEHPAVQYVAERGFDIDYLVSYFHVGFFKGKHNRFNWANKRLFIPVNCLGLPVGWTTRIIPGYTPTPEWYSGAPPKYHSASGFKKSWFLYNYDQAKSAGVIAVAEGVTDVWKIGTWGMALLGKTMSDQQCQLLCQAAEKQGAWIVLLGDASTERDNAAAAWEDNYQRLRASYKYPEQVRLHHCEQGDPSDLSSLELHRLVSGIIQGRG